MDRDQLHRAFLAELHELERFRLAYLGLHPGAGIDRDDPDVQRLVEALAFFSARTRLAASDGVDRLSSRLFRQHFGELLAPMPAEALVAAQPRRNHDRIVTLPRGTKLELVREPDSRIPDGTARRYSFLTLEPLRIAPIELTRVDLLPRASGYRLVFSFAVFAELDEELGPIRLQIVHLGELVSALSVFNALEKHVTAASYSVDRAPSEDDAGDGVVNLSFGTPKPSLSEQLPFERPLDRIRGFFHHPEASNALVFELEGQRPGCRRVNVYLDVDRDYPTGLRLGKDSFRLHVAPVVNLERQGSNPVVADGTKERYPLRHPDPKAGFGIHSVVGVFRTDGSELVPLRPSALSGGPNSYDVELSYTTDTSRGYLLPNLPRAFEEPVLLVTDCYWYQPELSGVSQVQYTVTTPDRFLGAVEWDLVGPPIAETLSTLGSDPERLLRLLSLHGQRFLEDASDLVFVLDALGARRQRQLDTIVSAIREVERTAQPWSKAPSGQRHRYRVRLDTLEQGLVPVLAAFTPRLLELLELWCRDEVVELTIEVPSLELTQRAHRGATGIESVVRRMSGR